MPLRPSRVETRPSCIAPPAASVGSSQWSATGMPKVRAYSSAVRMRWLETTGLPSSLTATAPAPTSSPNSASCCPFCPSEMAPMGYTRAFPARCAWLTMKPTAAWLSVTGSVLGIAHTAREAAGRRGHRAGGDRLDVLLPRLAQVHVQVDEAGRHDLAGGVEHLGAVGLARGSRPSASTLPSCSRRSATSSVLREGSMTRPPRMRIGRIVSLPAARMGPVGRAAGQQVEHRHPHGDAVGHLRQDDAVRAVGHVAVDLDAAVHRARVQDEQVLRARWASRSLVTPNTRLYSRSDGQEAGLHPLELEPEHVERVGPLDRVLDPRQDGDAELVHVARQQRWPGRRRRPRRPAWSGPRCCCGPPGCGGCRRRWRP